MKIQQVIFRELHIEDIKQNMLAEFNRYQKVAQVWRTIDGEKVIVDHHFTQDWDESDKNQIITKRFKECIEGKGFVVAAFYQDNIIGFAMLQNKPFGSENQYVQLEQLHISYLYRGLGVGNELFSRCVQKAKDWNVKKIYISSNSAIETIAFYTQCGCVVALEINQDILYLEPFDCQLEYAIQ